MGNWHQRLALLRLSVPDMQEGITPVRWTFHGDFEVIDSEVYDSHFVFDLDRIGGVVAVNRHCDGVPGRKSDQWNRTRMEEWVELWGFDVIQGGFHYCR